MPLLQVIKTYMDLLEKFSKGKKYLQFQNSWFFHINLYFNNSVKVEGITAERAEEISHVWKAILQKAQECNCTISTDDQRII